MEIDILFTVIVTSFLQSMFGVGVLLFGTPLLLLFGYDFNTALTILLPISALINIFQLIKNYKSIDFNFYKKMMIFTIPFIILFLYFVNTVQININIFIGCFLIIIAFQKHNVTVNNQIKKLMKWESIYLILMGIIHGLTNLGGSLLTAIIFNKNISKIKTRSTIAVCYLTFAVFQIITLSVLSHSGAAVFIKFLIYWVIGLSIFILVELTVYKNIDEQKYSKLFGVFLFISGLLLIFKNIL